MFTAPPHLMGGMGGVLMGGVVCPSGTLTAAHEPAGLPKIQTYHPTDLLFFILFLAHHQNLAAHFPFPSSTFFPHHHFHHDPHCSDHKPIARKLTLGLPFLTRKPTSSPQDEHSSSGPRWRRVSPRRGPGGKYCVLTTRPRQAQPPCDGHSALRQPNLEYRQGQALREELLLQRSLDERVC